MKTQNPLTSINTGSHCIHSNKQITFQDGGQIHQGLFTNLKKNGECVIEINGTTQSFTGAVIKNI